MAKKYLAFLGTTDYTECDYVFRNTHTQTRFVQEALTSALCRNWTKEDRILIFTTAEAKVTNWDSYNGRVGLNKRLSQLQLLCPHSQINIPEGDSVNALWDIFDTVFQELQEENEIIFDITHAFRSLPMLALIILNYAKFVRNCTLSGIYYGALEALGSIQDVKKMSVEERNVPIFDLTPFVSVLDWTVGIDRFLNTGDASVISPLTEKDVHRILKKTRAQHKQEAKNLKKMAKAISKFAQNCATCRGKKLSNSVLQVKKYIEHSLQSSGDLIKPLTPLLEKMQARFQVFEPHRETANIFEIVKWCREHNLIQQGITILEEGLITDLCGKLGLDADKYRDRLAVSRAIKIVARNNPKLEVEYNEKHKVHIETIRQYLPSEKFVSAFEGLRSARNDINHAGYTKQYKRAEKFQKTFDKLLTDFKEEISKLNS